LNFMIKKLKKMKKFFNSYNTVILNNESQDIKKEENPSNEEVEMPLYPDNCCGNGCQSCVFFEYYEKLEIYNNYISKKNNQKIDNVENTT
jgi:hypothetical protein